MDFWSSSSMLEFQQEWCNVLGFWSWLGLGSEQRTFINLKTSHNNANLWTYDREHMNNWAWRSLFWNIFYRVNKILHKYFLPHHWNFFGQRKYFSMWHINIHSYICCWIRIFKPCDGCRWQCRWEWMLFSILIIL